MAPAVATERLRALFSAVEAHLSDFDIRVEMLSTAQPSLSPQQRIRLVRHQTRDRKLLALLWIDDQQEAFHIIVPDGPTYKTLEQSIPHSADGWKTDCGTIAMVFRSSLAFWLSAESGGVVNLPTSITELSNSVAPATEQREAHSTKVVHPEHLTEKNVHVVAAAGYALSLIDLPGPAGHGMSLLLGLQAGKYVEGGLAVGLFQTVRLDIPEQEVRFWRWPVQFYLAGVLPLRIVDLSLAMGITVVFTRLRGLSQATNPDPNPLLGLAFSPALRARTQLSSWFGLWGEVGADIFTSARNYLWGDDIKLHFNWVQPRLILGVSVVFPTH